MTNKNVCESTSSDVNKIKIEDKEYIIIGTAHISKKSAELVHDIILKEEPDAVCIELDNQRFAALSEQHRWDAMDLKEIIKKKQLTTLFINILLAAYQKKLGVKLGTTPGIELIEAVKTAQSLNIPVVLCDRDVKITLRRTWNSMSFWQKIKFLSVSIASLFDKREITEEKLNEIKDKDIISELINDLGAQLPVLKRVLIDERDVYISQKMLETKGRKIVSVVGAGHVEGIMQKLNTRLNSDLTLLDQIPNSSNFLKIFGWSFPLLVLASLIYIGFDQGVSTASNNLIYWILITGIPSAIGAIFAFAHPLTILSSFFAAPITSLSPVLGVGYVAALVQALLSPPRVKEFHSVTDDINKFKLWWENKLLRVLLVFILSSIGGVIGTYLGTYEILTNALN
ncbi:MAG: TraB/GumN family protein [bacterium]